MVDVTRQSTQVARVSIREGVFVDRSGHSILQFPPYELDLTEEVLLYNNEAVSLRKKSFGVLSVLVQQRGQLVTVETLMDRVWVNVVVSPQVVKNCVMEVRQALGDHPREARYIQTVHGRGYRFIADTKVIDENSSTAPLEGQASGLVERQDSLQHLADLKREAFTGKRKLVFVAGEAGIGKSALLDTFCRIELEGEIALVGRGQCVQLFGGQDPFMPVIEALSEACKSKVADTAAFLQKFAPNWLARLPRIHGQSKASNDKRQSAAQGLAIELAEAIEAISATVPVAFILEDLQWADADTLRLLAVLARRRPTARFLLVASYRTEDVLQVEHPLPRLKQELLVHRKCVEIGLPLLTEEGILNYLERRFTPFDASGPNLEHLAQAIAQKTEGNPLFATEFIQNLVDREHLIMEEQQWRLSTEFRTATEEIPGDLLAFIDEQINRLDPFARQILEYASLSTMFSARLIADLVGHSIMEVEEACSHLAERDYMLCHESERILEDGSIVPRFRFIHNLHQTAIANRMPISRRLQALQSIGERIEELYVEDASSVYVDLAIIFERARIFGKASHYTILHAGQLLDSGSEEMARSQLARAGELLTFVRSQDERSSLLSAIELEQARVYYPNDKSTQSGTE